jgi:LuxR family transcriptional regulator, maltose regulon positive regulatory protein
MVVTLALPSDYQSVPRTGLLRRLEDAGATPLVSVTGPAGYGKTSLLLQWARRDPRPFAWLDIGRHDNDPAVLLTSLAVALDRVEPMEPTVFQALALPDVSIARTAPPRLGAALSARALPVVLVLDDFHILQDPDCLQAVVTIVEHLPQGSQLVIAGRGEPALPLARLRAEGSLAELGRDDLAMDEHEAGLLLRAEGPTVSDAIVVELTRRTEGWPAALRLAARVGSDRFRVDDLGSVALSRLSKEEARFLTRTAVLDRLTGPLCDAVLERTGSAALLESLERSNLLVIPLDRRRRWYRCHNLLRELLKERLERGEPELLDGLHLRASEWHERNGAPEAAIEHAMRAGDEDRVSRLVERHAQAAYCGGRLGALRTWLDWLEGRGLIERYPALAVLGSWVQALVGERAAAERLADMAERSSPGAVPLEDLAAFRGRRAVVRAVMCRAGVEAMRADARLALTLLPSSCRWRAPALMILGVSHLLAGDPDTADGILAGAFEVAEDVGAMSTASMALTERCVLAMRRDDWVQAELLAERARSILVDRAGLEDHATTVLLYAVAARVAIHRGDARRAHEELGRAQRLRPRLGAALPCYAVQARLELIRACIALTDVAACRTLLREVDDLLRERPDLGVLARQADELHVRLDTIRADVLGASSLTAAELRLLPCLVTHHSFREIGERLRVSPHTVKSQAMSIYRKFGVSSRGEAIRRARHLGLLAA